MTNDWRWRGLQAQMLPPTFATEESDLEDETDDETDAEEEEEEEEEMDDDYDCWTSQWCNLKSSASV